MLVFLAFVEWDMLAFGLLQKKFSHLARGALGLLAPLGNASWRYGWLNLVGYLTLVRVLAWHPYI